MSNALIVPQVLARPRRRTVIVVALWIAVAAAVAIRSRVMLAHPLPPGVPWLESGTDRYFLDFRDTIWTPGRFLLEGGNPYDPQSYQAAYPWALAFSLYAPVWLILAAALAPLPYLASIIVFQVISLAVAILMLTMLFRWTLPDHVDLAVPVALLWMNIWYPGRGALTVQLTTLLAVIGLTLVLRTVCQPRAESASTIDRADDRAGAWGVALSLLKPQFLTMAIVGLAAGRVRMVVRGVAGLALASLPVLVVCTLAAGGPIEFITSVRRDLDVANSAHHPSGLMFPGQRRLDLLGQAVRWGSGEPPGWLQVLVPLLFLVILPVIVVRLTRRPLAVSVVVCTSTLIGVYHGTYDVLILFIPAAIGLGMALRGELTRAGDRIAMLACLGVIVHLQTITTSLLPGFDYRDADIVNLLLLIVGLIAGLHTAWADHRESGNAGDRTRAPVATSSSNRHDSDQPEGDPLGSTWHAHPS